MTGTGAYTRGRRRSPGAVLHLRCPIKGGLLSHGNSRYSGQSGLQFLSALGLALPSVSVPPTFFATHRLYGMDWWLPRNCYRLQSGASTFTGSGLCDTLTLVAAFRAPSVAPWYPSSPSGSSLASLRISPAVLRLFTCCRSLTVNCSYDEMEGDYH